MATTMRLKAFSTHHCLSEYCEGKKKKKKIQQPILAPIKLPFRATSSGTTTTNQHLRPQLFLFLLLLLQVSHAKIRLDSQGKPNRHVEKDGETREETATPVLTRPNIYP